MNVQNLRQISEYGHIYRSPTIVVFLDLKAAFDSVNQQVLYKFVIWRAYQKCALTLFRLFTLTLLVASWLITNCHRNWELQVIFLKVVYFLHFYLTLIVWLFTSRSPTKGFTWWLGICKWYSPVWWKHRQNAVFWSP